MEHAVSLESIRPWRTAAIVASGVAALELLILVAAAIILLGHPFAQRAAKAALRPTHRTPTARVRPTSPAVLPPARTSVLVLNGNGRQGAAAAEASQVRAYGYRIGAVGNAPRPAQGPTLVMYRPGFQSEASSFAHKLGIGVVTALDGLRPSSLHRAQLVVVLGN